MTNKERQILLIGEMGLKNSALRNALVRLIKSSSAGGHESRAAEDHAIRLLVDQYGLNEDELRGVVVIGE